MEKDVNYIILYMIKLRSKIKIYIFEYHNLNFCKMKTNKKIN